MTTRINNPDTDADIMLRTCLDTKSNFIMIAGAGSGKTTSLVKALSYIANKNSLTLRNNQQKIACITYTTVAEKEILNDVGDDKIYHVSTIHSFLWEIIRPFQNDIKKWAASRITEKIEKLKEEQQNYGAKVHQKTKDRHQAEIVEYEETLKKITSVDNFTYETSSNFSKGMLGHDDILKMVPTLIEAKPLLRTIIANKYPYIFVDESQDTNRAVVSAFNMIGNDFPETFCLGYFGDPMQKIYTTGIGAIQPLDGWKVIEKPENFRCPKDVLDVINAIRKDGDKLQQTGGRRKIENGEVKFVKGNSYLFALPADEKRDQNLTKIRDFMSSKTNDEKWKLNEIGDTKLLVIEHRMAATRLGFPNLFSAFKDDSTDALATSFTEGKSWALSPFTKFILPLLNAYKNGESFYVMDLLRANSPLLQKESLKKQQIQPSELLNSFKVSISTLMELMSSESKATVKEVLQFTQQNNFIVLDERLANRMLPTEAKDVSADADIKEEDATTINSVIERYGACGVSELWGYYQYISEESVYSTQHSIKGAEFDRVIVVLDDEEGKGSTLYSYEKLFGLKDASKKDKENVEAGNDSVFDRTRRLLYVCCSRAKKDLAVVLFTQDPLAAIKNFNDSGIFKSECIIDQEMLSI